MTKIIKLNDVEYVEKSELDKVKALKGKVVKSKDCPFDIGGKYFIRTVTYFATGQVVAIHGKFLELADGAFIADTGRFADAMKSGEFIEVEPVDVPMFVNMDSITDAFAWNYELPRTQK